MPRKPALLTLVPWWVFVLVAVASYFLLHWLAQSAPLAPGTRLPDVVAASLAIPIYGIAQYLLPVLFAALAIVAALSRSDRGGGFSGPPTLAPRFPPPAAAPRLKRDAWSLELLRVMDAKRFEFLCASYFEALGFRVEVTHRATESGVDIRLYPPNQRRPGVLAQCKAWSTVPVGVQEVRELCGTMASGMVAEGSLLTTGKFTAEAVELARERNVTLIDGDDLLGKLLALPAAKRESLLQYATEGAHVTPTCASCGMKMIRKESKEDGKTFWECVKHPQRPAAPKAPA